MNETDDKKPSKKVEEIIFLGIALILFCYSVILAKDSNMLCVPISTLSFVSANIAYRYMIERKYK